MLADLAFTSMHSVLLLTAVGLFFPPPILFRQSSAVLVNLQEQVADSFLLIADLCRMLICIFFELISIVLRIPKTLSVSCPCA